MGILARFKDIVESNINAILDKCEDPSKMIDQYLRNAMEDLAEVKKETAAVMAEENRCKRLLDDATADVQKYTDLAKKALEAGNDDDARVFIAKKQECEANASAARNTYQVAHDNANKLRELHNKLSSDIAFLKARRDNVKATIAVAKTQDRVNKATEVMNGARGSVSAFERMEEKANAMLDSANAYAELNAEPVDEAAALEAKYGAGSTSSVDEELAAMKASLGL